MGDCQFPMTKKVPLVQIKSQNNVADFFYIREIVHYEFVESGWNVMAHGDAQEGKWRGNWRMEWVASNLTLPWNMVYPALLPFKSEVFHPKVFVK
jgi:hypothetical protein